jgi:hypothetical protein
VRHRWLEHHQRDTANVWRRRVLRGASTSPSTRSMEWDQRHWMSRLLPKVGDVVANSSTGILAATALTIWGLVGLPAGISGMMANHPACGHVVALATRAVSPRQDAARDVNSFCTRLLTWLLQFASTLGGGTRVSVPHVGFDSVSGFVLPGTQSQVRRDRE